MAKALADRLAEAFAECLHKQVRDAWGYGKAEVLSTEDLIREKYRGIRPAPGYPACPDHTEKRLLFDLLQAEQQADITLTESFAMLPAAVALTLVATGVLFWVVPRGFIPSEDTGQIIGFTEAAQDISFDSMVRHQQQVAAILRQDPNIDSFMSNVGSGGASDTQNTGRFGLMLKPRSERRLSADEIVQELRPKLAGVPGMRVFLQIPPLIRIGGQLSKSLYQYTLQGADIGELYRVSREVQMKLTALPALQEVTSDLQIASPKLRVEIDRDKASALGITANQVENALYNAYGSRQVSTIYTATNQYQVILELDPAYQEDPDALSSC